MNYRLIACAMALSVAFAGCRKKDEANPEIGSVTLNGATSNATVSAGSNLEVKATITDDRDLEGYGSTIHQNFDVHTDFTPSNEVIWEITGDLQGDEYELDATVVIPADATAGPHHFTLIVWDAEQKRSDKMIVDFTISNGSEPGMTLSQPNNGASFSVGSTIPVSGTANDNTDLASVELYVTKAGAAGDVGASSGFYDAYWSIPNGNDTQVDLSTLVQGNDAITVPAGTEAGDYTLKVIATDNEGNVATAAADFTVL